MGLEPSSALLNDINPHLINFYQSLQRGIKHDVTFRNNRFQFNRHRERFNSLIRSGQQFTQEAAALFYYLNRTGYNGLCRFNRKGGFNVPFGRHTTISYKQDFSGYRERFKRYQFLNRDFEQLPTRLGDFIYADPPYDVEFTQYSPEGFDWADQVRVAHC